MRYTEEQSKLLYKAEIAPGIFNFTLAAPKIAAAAAAGQFVTVLCEGFELRRPISLCGFDAASGILRLVFEVRGKGTAWLAQRQAGEYLSLVGPLGHGFSLLEPDKKVLLVGGGIGTPPLLPVARHYGGNAAVITGFRNAASAILQEDFKAVGAQTILCTDDGSAGFHGFTTQAMEQHLAEAGCDVVYTCGPKVMMKRVAEQAREKGIPCWVSMEERMACGVGACLVCACQVLRENGQATYLHVCKDGPVFESEVIFHD